MTKFFFYRILLYMFVSVVIDPGGRESASHLAEVLTANGFERVQHACWESVTINDEGIVTLKQDIDRVTDYYDIVRLYQYPIQDVFAVTTLYKKKWRRVLVRPPAKKLEN